MIAVRLGSGTVCDPFAVRGDGNALVKLTAVIEVEFFTIWHTDRQVDGFPVLYRILP